MWRLLFTEREYVPLPWTWHTWHLVTALVTPALVWWLLSRTRSQMTALSAAKAARVEAAAVAEDDAVAQRVLQHQAAAHD